MEEPGSFDDLMDLVTEPSSTYDGTAMPRPILPRKRNEDLTPQEFRVVQLMADGLSNKLIADALDISEHTAKFHVNNVCTKLDVTTRTGAVAQAFRKGLVR